jgi:DNA (cytosine-5)-methyltransferase 1
VTLLKAVSLFSNCGAGDVGYRGAGFRFEVMAELDPRRLEVCLLNHPGAVGVAGDLRRTWRKVVAEYRSREGDARPALLCACPPCQGMSSARSGKGHHHDADAGSRDDRNLLVTVIAKVAKNLKPAIIVVENVHAFLTRRVRHPRDNHPISAANFLISALANDYVVYPFISDLADFGIPQTRVRAFLTFVRHDVDGLGMLKRRDEAPYPIPTHDADAGGEMPITLYEALRSFGLPPLNAKRAATASVDGFNGMHSVPIWDERTYAMIRAIPEGSGRSAWQNEECHQCGHVKVSTKAARCPRCNGPLLRPVFRNRNGSYRLVNGFKTSYRRMKGNVPASTITTASGHLGSDYTIHPRQTRLLSPLECALLQTFPDNFKWGDALAEWGSTNVRDMIGEAVPPAFTALHGRVLAGIVRESERGNRLPITDDRMKRAWKRLVKSASNDGRKNPRRAEAKQKQNRLDAFAQNET